MIVIVTDNILSAWWFQTWCSFPISYMGSSFPLTNSIIFQDGHIAPPSRLSSHDFPFAAMERPHKPKALTWRKWSKDCFGSDKYLIYIYMYIGNMISYGNVWLLNIIINIWIWYWIAIFFVISMGCHQQCSKFVLTRKPIYVSYWYLSIYYIIDRPVYLRSTDAYILCVI